MDYHPAFNTQKQLEPTGMPVQDYDQTYFPDSFTKPQYQAETFIGSSVDTVVLYRRHAIFQRKDNITDYKAAH